ncbi:hypothetical protein CEXT_613631 [Caerostris extrusa]|uniref:Uncharacterized protein n=1 Tax=Caerostris extrusa TaxID=172846 RepID=A0AAV4XG80_CAEEX|nr:hypothetical protein CEXT_613631 [Caerostris extrusa]
MAQASLSFLWTIDILPSPAGSLFFGLLDICCVTSIENAKTSHVSNYGYIVRSILFVVACLNPSKWEGTQIRKPEQATPGSKGRESPIWIPFFGEFIVQNYGCDIDINVEDPPMSASFSASTSLSRNEKHFCYYYPASFQLNGFAKIDDSPVREKKEQSNFRAHL